MLKYAVPESTSHVVFYPFRGDVLLTSEEVKDRFPRTWDYLESNADGPTGLKARKSLSRVGHDNWWRPLWPRQPKHMLRPKIVSPQLVLFPRFALDEKGAVAVSHGPYVYYPSDVHNVVALKYLLAVLNSSVGHWQVMQHSHKFSRGYAKLEPLTLANVYLPSPAAVPTTKMNAIVALVDKLIE